MSMILRSAAALRADRMGVVEAHQPLTLRSVQRQRIVETVRLYRRCRHPRYDKAHPMTAIRIDNKHLPIEVEKRVE